MKQNTAELVRALAVPIAEKFNLSVWDVTYEKLGGAYELTVYIDSDGAVSTDDCEKMSRALEPVIDRADPIKEAYLFSVSSAGTERVLRTDDHFQKYVGEEIKIKLYTPYNGESELEGTLVSHSGQETVIKRGETEITLLRAQIAAARAKDKQRVEIIKNE